MRCPPRYLPHPSPCMTAIQRTRTLQTAHLACHATILKQLGMLHVGLKIATCHAGGYISVPAKIGKAAPSTPAFLAAASATPEAHQPDQQDVHLQAEEQPSMQPEASSGTLDFTAPVQGREQSSAVEGRPWAQAFLVEERHVITEPLHPGSCEKALHASSEASLYRHRLLDERLNSNSLSGIAEQQRLPPGGSVLAQLQQDSQGDLAAALRATAACTPLPSWPGDGRLHSLRLDPAGEVAAASDSAGIDMIPDTVQKQDAAFPDRAEGAHELYSSSKKQTPALRRSFIPDSLDDNEYHLQPPSALKGLRDMR